MLAYILTWNIYKRQPCRQPRFTHLVSLVFCCFFFCPVTATAVPHNYMSLKEEDTLTYMTIASGQTRQRTRKHPGKQREPLTWRQSVTQREHEDVQTLSQNA